MKGTVLLAVTFPTFRLAHRIEHGQHYFEVAYGSSFSGLYYDFTPAEFFVSPDRNELTKQLKRAGAVWALPLLRRLASET